jgi:hypothetical protein
MTMKCERSYMTVLKRHWYVAHVSSNTSEADKAERKANIEKAIMNSNYAEASKKRVIKNLHKWAEERNSK